MTLKIAANTSTPSADRDIAAGGNDDMQSVYHGRMAEAIAYVVDYAQDQPSLDTMAAKANLSPHHFQRIFKRWAGISPKKFLQYVTLNRAKRALALDSTLLDTALDAGLS
ncbi:MAG: helix-turn-helix domain-containing protein, partial [Geminicoccaceae bacterium]